MSFDKDVNRIQSNFQTTNATETQAEHRCCVNLHEQIIEAYLPPRWKKGCYTRQLVPPPYPRTKTTLCLVLVSTIYNFIVRLPLNTTLHNASQQSTRTSCGTNVCYLLYTVFGSSVSCVSYSCKLLAWKLPLLRNWNLWTMPWATRRTASRIIVKRCMRPRATRAKKGQQECWGKAVGSAFCGVSIEW